MNTALQVIRTSSSEALSVYLQSVFSIPTLDAKEEESLAIRYREKNDLNAAWSLLLANLRYVVKIARCFKGYNLPLEDLIQEGNIGLMKAVKKFEPGHSVRLMSFAEHWIRSEILEFVLRNWRIVKVGTTKAKRKLFFNLRKIKKNLGWLSQRETTNAAKELGVTENDVKEVEKHFTGHDDTIYTTDVSPEEKHYKIYHNQLRDNYSNPSASIEQDEWHDLTKIHLNSALEVLDARSRNIIVKRWLTEDKAKLKELAAEYNVSIERIRQLESKALELMKNVLQNNELLFQGAI